MVDEQNKQDNIRRLKANVNVHIQVIFLVSLSWICSAFQKTFGLIEKLLRHHGWRTSEQVYNYHISSSVIIMLLQSHRSNELQQIRDEFYSEVIKLFVSACEHVEELKPIVDLTVLLADETLGIQKVSDSK